MNEFKWSIGPEEYMGKTGIEHRSIWWLYKIEICDCTDKNGNTFKISQYGETEFRFTIGDWYPYPKIIFEETFTTLKQAQDFGEIKYLKN